jgi:hypothetical protein
MATAAASSGSGGGGGGGGGALVGNVRAQNSDVIEVQTSDGEMVYLWSADLWFSARSGWKGDDHQY